MSTLPLICFYKKGTYLVSSRYRRHFFSGPAWLDQMKQCAEEEPETIKVIAVSYESGYHLHGFPTEDDSAYLFFLDEYRVMSKEEMLGPSQHFTFQKLIPSIDKDTYRQKIGYIKDAISKGKVYQLNFTFPFEGHFSGPSEQLFYYFSRIFAGDYHAFLPLQGSSFLCFSPELFLEKTGSRLISRPVKGTSKPNASAVSDLMRSSKENAELSMIVDLIRNDLHRVSPGSQVTVTAHRELLKLGNLVHTYSELETHTRRLLPEILRHTFPGGSISGCPKHSAMQWIRDLESGPRGFYTGSIGWWEKEDFSLNIAIRSIHKSPSGALRYGSGGGIVFESIAEKEYTEALLKASGMNERIRGGEVA